MFQTTPDSQDFARQCCGRIELIPSWRAAAFAASWLAAVGAMTLLAVALPLPARIAICVCAATFGLAAIRETCLLAGAGSIKSIAWNDRGQLMARVGISRVQMSAELVSGSFRLGSLGLVLWLKTCDGFHTVIIDSGMQDMHGIRRLARRLHWAPKRSPDERGAAS